MASLGREAGRGTPQARLGRRLRLGFVGGGADSVIGATHRYGARLDGRYDIVAGALDIDPARGRDFARELLLPEDRIYGSCAELIEKESARPDKVDLVGVLTPNHAHFDSVDALLRAGFHVLCEKPLTTEIGQAVALARLAQSSGLVLAVMYGYSGYPMIREARSLVRSGALGAVRLIETEFATGNPATMSEDPNGHWRTKRGLSGSSAVLGMIGTHAVHLATYVSGLALTEISADLSTFVPGRQLEDNAQAMLRFEQGARGAMWASYVAAGQEHGLRLRLFGETGGLAWDQQDPNHLVVTRPGQEPRRLSRASPLVGAAAQAASRVAIGHPEGFIEAFANIYGDVADAIAAKLLGEAWVPDYPNERDGVLGVRFIDAAIESSAANGRWTDATATL